MTFLESFFLKTQGHLGMIWTIPEKVFNSEISLKYLLL